MNGASDDSFSSRYPIYYLWIQNTYIIQPPNQRNENGEQQIKNLEPNKYCRGSMSLRRTVGRESSKAQRNLAENLETKL